MQQWFTLSDPAMEEVFFNTPCFANLRNGKNSVGFLTNSLSFVPVIAWKSTSSPSIFWPQSMPVERGLLLKAGTVVDAKVEHPFRVIKRQFGFIKVR